MIDPSIFIAPFALLYALYIILVYAAIYARKKILEEGRNWRGIPELLGIVAFFVVIGIVYFGIYTFYSLYFAAFFIIPVLIAIPLVIAFRANTKIKRKDRIGYQVIHKEISWRETVGILGPVLVLIGSGMLFFMSFLSLGWGGDYVNYLPNIFTWLCSLLGFMGVILGLKGRNYGKYICFIAGVLAIVGSFIPIGFWGRFITISILYFDPYIVGIGGILSIISQDDFLMYYLKGREFTEEVTSIEDEIGKIKDLKTFLQEKLGPD